MAVQVTTDVQAPAEGAIDDNMMDITVKNDTKHLILYEEIIEDDVLTVLKSIVVDESLRYTASVRWKVVRSEKLAPIW